MTRPGRRPRDRKGDTRGKAAPRPRAFTLPPPVTFALLALAVLFASFIRLRMLPMPLERDEGEYAYAGQLILHGVPPYTLAYNMKLPGIYGAYALVTGLFGATKEGVHLGLLLVNAATILLVFALGRRFRDAYAGAIAAIAYAVLSTSQSVLGLAAHATHFIVLPALGGVLLLLRSDERPRLRLDFLAGLLLGLAFLMKQHGAVFVAFGLLVTLTTPLRIPERRWKEAIARSGALLLGALLPLGVTCLLLWRAGAFDRFWFWTVSYARAYASEVPLKDARLYFTMGFARVTGPSLGLWLLAMAGLFAAWLDRTRRREALVLSGFTACSALGITPGFYFREHYFILLLPAVAILAGEAVSAAARLFASLRFPAVLCFLLSGALFALPAAQTVLRQRATLFERTPEEVCRDTYGANPFPEALEIARYIEARSKPGDRVAVLGSEPEIYFYARRRSATGHIYMYGLMERQPFARRMQEEMIREIETARPAYLVFVNVSTSWLATEQSEKLLLDWLSRYPREHYDPVGIIDIPQVGRATYRWEAQMAGYAPRSPYVITVYRRRPGV